MPLVRLETAPLFDRLNVSLDSVTPKFSRLEMEKMEDIFHIPYDISLGAGGHGVYHELALPNGMKIQVCTVGEETFYGSYIALINRCFKEFSSSATQAEKDAYDWLSDNVDTLMISSLYWGAVKARE